MPPKKGKHLINSLENAVAENLLGYARQHAQVQFVPSLNLIINKSIAHHPSSPASSRRKTNRVVGLLSGAGSGHEPVMHGFVGDGGLDVSVAGQVFASPSTGQVMEGLRLLSQAYNEILIVVNNYTGDRLNFGLAAERAKIELGIRCKLFCFGDDVAFDAEKNAKTGRRGLAGGTFLNMCLGSLADKGFDLDQMFDHAVRIGSLIATMSVSLTSCDVPGSGASFELADNEVELGLGIHGEPGVRRTNTLLSSKEAVSTMMEAIVSSLNISVGQRIAVLVNNIGGLSNFDLNIVTKDVIEEVSRRKFVIDRLMVGSYCTSFSMIGVSLSVLRVDDELTKLLDTGSSAPLFNGNPVLELNPDPVFEFKTSGQAVKDDSWIDVPGVTREQFGIVVTAAAESMIEAEQLLNDLDRCGGDADCGLTAKKGASAIINFIKGTTARSTPSFLQLADITSNEMGGTSGAIYSLLFTSIHSSVKSCAESGSKISSRKDIVKFWAEALDLAMRTVTTYSLAEPGDRTMLDTVAAVRNSLSKDDVSLSAIAEAARDGAASTSSMRAKAGRSSYATSGTIADQPDAGAVALATWISAALSSLK